VEYRRGIIAGISAYWLWGASPIFWNAIKMVPPLELLAWRVVWALLFLALFILVTRRGEVLRMAYRNPRTRMIAMASGALLTVNWALFIWAVTHEHLVEISLGYYINPLMSVALAVLVLGESLSRAARLAVAMTAVAVIVMTIAAGETPWISLSLAITFALYGLLKKQPDAAPPFEALMLESATAAVPLFAYLAWLILNNDSVVTASTESWALLPFTGLITIAPLVLFATAAQRIPLATLGMLQYLAPTIQLGLGVWLYGEAVSRGQFIGFVTVWIALGIFAVDSARTLSSNRKSPRDAT
jgi:chloramphenicol-sensitive protein RarD